MRKILFVAEAVTLAQVVRLVTLARALDPRRYEVHFASSEFPKLVFEGTSFVQHRIETLDAKRASRALDAGERLYEKRVLMGYVEAELRLMDAIAPELAIGDFRLSLPISAEKRGVPSAVLINAYWSPYAQRTSFPVPDHPIVRWLGEARTERAFPMAIPRVFAHFASPVNATRKAHGLAPVGSLLEVLSHGDTTLYPDDSRVVPLLDLPSNHRVIGPVFWEPAVPLPNLDFAEPGRPLIYVTLGSSGKVDVLPQVIEALRTLPVNAVIATADRADLSDLPPHVRAVPYVPGAELARRAKVVVSNGGSTTGYQALREGTPVLGIPSNFDQHLATQAIDRVSAGTSVKARLATPVLLREALCRTLEDPGLSAGAQAVAQSFAKHDSSRAFRSWVEATLPPAP